MQHAHQVMVTEERYQFTAGAKKRIFIFLAIGVVLTVLGLLMSGSDGHGDDHHAAIEASQTLMAGAAEGGDGHHGESSTLKKRVYTNLWINNVYFAGLAVIGLFFVAIQYAAQAGWSAGIKRIPLAMASWLPIAAVLMLVVYFMGGHDIFHWTHTYLYDKTGESFDAIINGKKAFFFWPLHDTPGFPIFFVLRMVVFFGLWYLFLVWIRKEMLAEDINGGTQHWFKARKLSAIFLVIFAVTSSIAAWDWIMSIDTHWFSTMFGWYVFASWWVNGLAVIALVVVLLKDQGYLKIVNANHLHDLGKFIFGFSVFWTYIWFSQFLLIYYANIPEETVYFIERLSTDPYSSVLFTNLVLNFFLPFLLLMTRDAKRHMSFLKVITPIIIVGHWFDFYLMVTPGIMQTAGGFNFLEIGLAIIYASAFVYVMLHSLAKAPLFAKNHPMLEESLHHHI
jgi:hypothetical protein